MLFWSSINVFQDIFLQFVCLFDLGFGHFVRFAAVIIVAPKASDKYEDAFLEMISAQYVVCS